MREGCLWSFGRGGEEVEIVLCSPPHAPLASTQPRPGCELHAGDLDSEFILNILITNLECFQAKMPKNGFSLWLVLSVRK